MRTIVSSGYFILVTCQSYYFLVKPFDLFFQLSILVNFLTAFFNLMAILPVNSFQSINLRLEKRSFSNEFLGFLALFV